MSCNECTVKYYAFDKTVFKTEKECIKYNELPRVYIVESSYCGHRSDIEVFVHKEMAEIRCTKLKKSSMMYHYEVKATVIHTGVFVKTVQEKVTNTPSKKWYDIFK